MNEVGGGSCCYIPRQINVAVPFLFMVVIGNIGVRKFFQWTRYEKTYKNIYFFDKLRRYNVILIIEFRHNENFLIKRKHNFKFW